MKDRIKVVNEKVDYSKDNHRLYRLNTIVGDIKNNIIGIYHGAKKIDLPLSFREQEYRFNHRNTGKQMITAKQGRKQGTEAVAEKKKQRHCVPG